MIIEFREKSDYLDFYKPKNVFYWVELYKITDNELFIYLFLFKITVSYAVTWCIPGSFTGYKFPLLVSL